jgi:hypothetical protein
MREKRDWKAEEATEKQYAFATKLLNSKLGATETMRLDKRYVDTLKCLETKQTPAGHLLTKGYMSKLIDGLMALPNPVVEAEAEAKPATETKATAITDGMWLVREEGKRDAIFKVQQAVYGSGRLYAKQLTLFWDNGIELREEELAALDDDEVAEGYRKGGEYYGELKAKFVKITGGVKHLQQESKRPGVEVRLLKKEEAIHFGKLYGICAICGRLLTDETSIEAGIGPICASKF